MHRMNRDVAYLCCVPNPYLEMNDPKKSLSRREFLKKAGVATLAASAVSQFGILDAVGRPAKKAPAGGPVNADWDVIVAGGGPAGCAAAVASAREGAKTLLIEATGMLGGMGTAGNMNCWCPFTDGEKIIYKGIAEKVFTASKNGVPVHKGRNDWLPINTEQLKRVYDGMVAESGADILLFTQIAGVEMAGNGTVDHIVVANKNGLTRYRARVYVDCTGDGDLAAWAGADYFYGDGQNSVQSSTLCFTIAGVNHEAYKKDGNKLHNASPASPIHKILASGKYPLIPDEHFNVKMVHPGVLAFNAGHLSGINSTSPDDLTRGMIQGRRLVEEIHRALRAESPDMFGESYLTSTGSLLGIRESRRIRGDYVFTVDDWVARRSFDDQIGRNCYYIDVHKEGVKRYPRYAKGESHGIPFRTLVPEKLSNVLIAGRSISCDDYAYGSLRIMPVCLVTGEAAGLGAALASRMGRVDVHSIDIPHLRKRLAEEGQNI